MTVFDYAVVLTIGFSALLGMWRGVVSELLALAAWVLAIVLARAFAHRLAVELAPWIADPALQYLMAFAVIVAGVLLLAALLRLVMKSILGIVGLGFIDRVLGALFGVMRGVVLVLAGVLVGGLTALPKQVWWHEAILAPPLETAVVAMKPWLPVEWAKRIRYR